MIRQTKNTWWTLPALCAATALVIRLVALYAFQSSVLFNPLLGGAHDRSIYLDAIRLAAHGLFWPGGAFEFLPLYPWLAGFIASIFGMKPIVLAGFGILCDVLTTWLIVRFAQRLSAGRIIAAAAGLLYAAYPMAVIYCLLNMPNTLNALGVTAFSFAAHNLIQQPPQTIKRRPSFILGLFGGVMTLGFAGMLMIGAVVAVFLFVRSRSWAMAALFVTGLALPVIPLSVHNSRSEGQFVLLSTHGGFNFYMGNNERATGYPLRLFNFRMTAKAMLTDAHRYAEQKTGTSMSRAESSAWWKGQARNYWKTHPADAMQLTLKKAALFWNYKNMDDLRMLEQLRITDTFFRFFHGTPYAIISLMGLLGILSARGAAVPRAILLAGMIGLVMFFITARYQLTFVPLMLAMGAAGFRKPTRRIACFVIIPMLALVLWPNRVKDQRAIDHYNAATQLTSAGQTEKAMEVIDRGLEIDPNFDQLHAARGTILFQRENYAGAAASFITAVQLNPAHEMHYYNLALCLARSGDICGARDALANAQQRGVRLNERPLELLKELDRACGQ